MPGQRHSVSIRSLPSGQSGSAVGFGHPVSLGGDSPALLPCPTFSRFAPHWLSAPGTARLCPPQVAVVEEHTTSIPSGFGLGAVRLPVPLVVQVIRYLPFSWPALTLPFGVLLEMLDIHMVCCSNFGWVARNCTFLLEIPFLGKTMPARDSGWLLGTRFDKFILGGWHAKHREAEASSTPRPHLVIPGGPSTQLTSAICPPPDRPCWRVHSLRAMTPHSQNCGTSLGGPQNRMPRLSRWASNGPCQHQLRPAQRRL